VAGKITEMTALSGALALTDLLEVVDDPGGSPLSRKATFQLVKDLLGGQVVQVVNTQTGAVATGTTTIPMDDTIPQNTEGTEFMTLAITPTTTNHKLRIDVVFIGGIATGDKWPIVALFQDTTADALAVAYCYGATATEVHNIKFSHYMTAGTTSATTFKVRAGPNVAATITFNGRSGARDFGGVIPSSITITEIRA
jgi:hypothetical protein